MFNCSGTRELSSGGSVVSNYLRRRLVSLLYIIIFLSLSYYHFIGRNATKIENNKSLETESREARWKLSSSINHRKILLYFDLRNNFVPWIACNFTLHLEPPALVFLTRAGSKVVPLVKNPWFTATIFNAWQRSNDEWQCTRKANYISLLRTIPTICT